MWIEVRMRTHHCRFVWIQSRIRHIRLQIPAGAVADSSATPFPAQVYLDISMCHGNTCLLRRWWNWQRRSSCASWMTRSW